MSTKPYKEMTYREKAEFKFNKAENCDPGTSREKVAIQESIALALISIAVTLQGIEESLDLWRANQ